MTRQWVNIEDEGAPHALLQRLGQRVPVSNIDTVWVFPTRRSTGLESTVIVCSAFDNGGEKRRVSATRFLVTRDRKGKATVDEQYQEYATAPADTLPRVLDGVMRRLGDSGAPPGAYPIERDAERWNELLRQLGGTERPGGEGPGQGQGQV